MNSQTTPNLRAARRFGSLLLALAPAMALAGPCQEYAGNEQKKIEADYARATAQCGAPNSAACWKAANANKAAAQKALGERLRVCESMKPIGPAQMDPRYQWSQEGSGTAIYTDEKSQRWAFETTIQQGPFTWLLQRSGPPRTNQMGAIREVYATYKEIQNRQPPKQLAGRKL